MSRRFVLSSPASRDLDQILEYVLEHSGSQRALRVADRLEKCFQNIAKMPGMGHKREDLTDASVRFYAVWSYLIVYKPDSSPLEIARVLHGARDVKALLGES